MIVKFNDDTNKHRVLFTSEYISAAVKMTGCLINSFGKIDFILIGKM